MASFREKCILYSSSVTAQWRIQGVAGGALPPPPPPQKKKKKKEKEREREREEKEEKERKTKYMLLVKPERQGPGGTS